eukprot:UN13765
MTKPEFSKIDLEGLEQVSSSGTLDQIISIIRSSSDEAEASLKIAADFNLTSKQSDAICSMKLSRLTNLGIEKLKTEIDEKSNRVNELIDIVGNSDKLDSIFIERMNDSLSVCTSPKTRLTELTDD